MSWQPFVPDISNMFDFPDVGVTRSIPITTMGPRSTVNGAFHLEIPVYISWLRQRAKSIYGDGANIATFSMSQSLTVPNSAIRSSLMVILVPGLCFFSFPFHAIHNGEDDDCYRRAGQEAPLRIFAPIAIEIPHGQAEEFGIAASDILHYVHQPPHDTSPVP